MIEEFLVVVKIHTFRVYYVHFFSQSKVLGSDSFRSQLQKLGISRILESFAAKDLRDFFFNQIDFQNAQEMTPTDTEIFKVSLVLLNVFFKVIFRIFNFTAETLNARVVNDFANTFNSFWRLDCLK